MQRKYDLLADAYVRVRGQLDFAQKLHKREMDSSQERTLLNFTRSNANHIVKIYECLLPQHHKLLFSVLETLKVNMVVPKVSDHFDPKFHEALSGSGDTIKNVVRPGISTLEGVGIQPALVELD